MSEKDVLQFVYFDIRQTEEAIEKEYELLLRGFDESIPWSVKNQARMHVKNGSKHGEI